MITYIHSATILVSDQERALDFYVNKLGWEKRIDQMMGDGYRFVTVGPIGGQTELALGPAHILGGTPGGAINPGRGMEGASGISFSVEDVAGTYQALTERGVQFSGPPEETPWGHKATWLIDPDGNRFFFVGN